MKTHKGTKKRFRLSAKGKAKHRQAGKSHRNVRMDAKRTRNLRQTSTLDGAVEQKIQIVLGKYSN